MGVLDRRRGAAARWALRATRRPAPGAQHEATRSDRRARAAFALALAAFAGAVGLWLAHAAPHRAGTDGVFSQATLALPGGTTVCQGGQLLPAGTAALRIDGTATGQAAVVVRRAGRLLDRVPGRDDASRGQIVARVRPLARDLDGVDVCLALGAPATLLRGPTPPLATGLRIGRPYPGDSLAIEYVLPGPRSWWGMADAVADRMERGWGRAGGPWIPWAVAALMAASVALAAVIALRTLVRRRPLRGLPVAIMAVAVLGAAAWSLITPAFQVPDEVAHVAYVQALGETGRPPSHPLAMRISPEEATAMADTRFGSVAAPTYRAAVWSASQRQRLLADLARPLSRRQTVPIGPVEPEPPLYYALQTIPYRMACHATLLGRMLLMRLLSALLAGATALLAFLFVRECLPARPWAWTVGGLGVALTPMLGFVSGGVHPDALAYALAAALFLALARAWRRGVTVRLAAGVGMLLAVGMLTKVNLYGLVPGALLGLLLAARRTAFARERRVAPLSLRLLGIAGVVAGGLLAAGIAVQLLVWHVPFAVGRPPAPESHVGLWSHIGYIWQVFLPRLPFQPRTSLIEPGYVQLFHGFVGNFGRLMVSFPPAVYRAAAAVLGVVALLALRDVLADRRELRWRRGELIGYAAMAGVLLLMIGVSVDLRRNLIEIVQGRYLLPLLPLFGLLLALGARGAGERWGRAFGVALVGGAVAWSVFGQLATIAFFYG